jgi:hypothetical protein
MNNRRTPGRYEHVFFMTAASMRGISDGVWRKAGLADIDVE